MKPRQREIFNQSPILRPHTPHDLDVRNELRQREKDKGPCGDEDVGSRALQRRPEYGLNGGLGRQQVDPIQYMSDVTVKSRIACSC